MINHLFFSLNPKEKKNFEPLDIPLLGREDHYIRGGHGPLISHNSKVNLVNNKIPHKTFLALQSNKLTMSL